MALESEQSRVLSREGLQEVLAAFAIRWEMEFSPDYRARLDRLARGLRRDFDRYGVKDARDGAVGVLIGAMGLEAAVRRSAGQDLPLCVEDTLQQGLHSVLRLLTEAGGV